MGYMGYMKWSASDSGRLTTDERADGIHKIRNWVGPRTGLYVASKRKFLAPARHRTPITQPEAQSPY